MFKHIYGALLFKIFSVNVFYKLPWSLHPLSVHCVLSLQEVLNGNLEREAYIGHDAEHMRGVLTLKHPIKNGIIHNWDEMEKVRLVFA